MTAHTIAELNIFRTKNNKDMPAASDFCKQVQTRLNDVIGKGAIPQQLRTRNGVGFVDALRSQANVSGVEQLQSSFQTSKQREVILRYMQRADATVATSATDPCVAGGTKLYLEDTFSTTDYVEKKCSFDLADWIAFCESGSDTVAMGIASLFDPLLQQVDKVMVDKASALVLPASGVADTNLAPIAITLFQDFSTRSINLAGQDDLINAFADIQASLQPIVVGQGVMRNYANVADYGCCNQLGQDIEAVMANSPFLYFDDRNVPGQLGLGSENDLYAWEPGKVQLVTWNRYQDEQAWQRSQYEYNGTIVDPISGVRFDAKARIDDCNQYPVVTLTLSLDYGQWTIPTDSFPAGDEYEGVKYLLRFRAS